MSVNQRVKILRVASGLKQIPFAKSIGISQSMLARYEKEGVDIPSSVISVIIEKYHVFTNWLLFGEGGDEPQYQKDYIVKEKTEDLITVKKSEYTSMLEQLVKYQQKELEEQKAKVLEQENTNQTISTPQTSNIFK